MIFGWGVGAALYIATPVIVTMITRLMGFIENVKISESDISTFYSMIERAIIFIPLDIILSILTIGSAWLTIQLTMAIFNLGTSAIKSISKFFL